MGKRETKPWAFLDEFRGVDFNGQWPNLKEMFHITAKRYPDRKCWTEFGKDPLTLTYREAEEKIVRVAGYLRSQGVTKDSHVGLSGRNSVNWALGFFSAVYAGAVIVPLDNAIHGDDLKKFVSFGDVDFFIGDGDRLDYVKDGVKGCLCLDSDKTGFPLISDVALKEELPDSAYNPMGSDVAAILFTSGTTGLPKGVMLTHDNLVSCCYQAQANINTFYWDVYYAVLPLHHAYTMQAAFFEPMSVGAQVVFGKKLTVNQLLSDLKEGQITIFLGVPLLFNKLAKSLQEGLKKRGAAVYRSVNFLLHLSGFLRDVLHLNVGKKMFAPLLKQMSLENTRLCISGGGPLPEFTASMFHRLGIDFVQGYGMTETSPITHLDPVENFVLESVGQIISPYQQKIVEPDDEGNGLIFIKGSCVMKGYYKNPQATSEVLDQDGWLNTGDVGHIDEHGYLYLSGRRKNVIVTEGGKNVFPEEIEDCFQLYDELAQVCIIPYIEDPVLKNEGVRLLALPSESLIEKCSGNSAEIEREISHIVDEVNSNLISYKKITKLTVIDKALETTSSAKIKRAEAIKRYADC